MNRLDRPLVDAYFSGTKIKHLLDSYDGLRARAARGEVLFGTIDTFLLDVPREMLPDVKASSEVYG